jgi:hypothetical protein
MTFRLLALSAALCLALSPSLASADPPKEAAKAAEEKPSKAKKKLKVDFSETPCEGDDCIVKGEVHEPQVQYVLTRKGVAYESADDAMRREEQSLRKAAAAKKAKEEDKKD